MLYLKRMSGGMQPEFQSMEEQSEFREEVSGVQITPARAFDCYSELRFRFARIRCVSRGAFRMAVHGFRW